MALVLEAMTHGKRTLVLGGVALVGLVSVSCWAFYRVRSAWPPGVGAKEARQAKISYDMQDYFSAVKHASKVPHGDVMFGDAAETMELSLRKIVKEIVPQVIGEINAKTANPAKRIETLTKEGYLGVTRIAFEKSVGRPPDDVERRIVELAGVWGFRSSFATECEKSFNYASGKAGREGVIRVWVDGDKHDILEVESNEIEEWIRVLLHGSVDYRKESKEAGFRLLVFNGLAGEKKVYDLELGEWRQ
jgi:hypothetical protein